MSYSDRKSAIEAAARDYASRFRDRDEKRAVREVGFEAGARWADENGHPDELPGSVAPVVCDRLNPCPDRPRHFLGRYTDRPWRCPQCSRWWVTQHRSSYATYDSGGFYAWVRAEATR